MTCEDCLFFGGKTTLDDCFRFPPVPVVMQTPIRGTEMDVIYVLPKVRKDHFCGEHKPKRGGVY